VLATFGAALAALAAWRLLGGAERADAAMGVAA
jgi:hypothetical protein